MTVGQYFIEILDYLL